MNRFSLYLVDLEDQLRQNCDNVYKMRDLLFNNPDEYAIELKEWPEADAVMDVGALRFGGAGGAALGRCKIESVKIADFSSSDLVLAAVARAHSSTTLPPHFSLLALFAGNQEVCAITCEAVASGATIPFLVQQYAEQKASRAALIVPTRARGEEDEMVHRTVIMPDASLLFLCLAHWQKQVCVCVCVVLGVCVGHAHAHTLTLTLIRSRSRSYAHAHVVVDGCVGVCVGHLTCKRRTNTHACARSASPGLSAASRSSRCRWKVSDSLV
jgi:hypothetical protein